MQQDPGPEAVGLGAVGLGDSNARLSVYIANRPPLAEYQTLQTVRAMHAGEIARIAAETGNHWRKIFNVYAKLAFALDDRGFTRWQDLRDQLLLQQDSGYALLFSPPPLKADSTGVRLLLGKGYAAELGLAAELIWLDDSFARHRERDVLVCPYFDYRQLSDEKIRRLAALLKSV